MDAFGALLSEARVDTDLRDGDGKAAAHHAASNPRGARHLKLLSERAGAKLDLRNADGQTPLMVAAAKGNLGPARVLLGTGARAGITLADTFNRYKRVFVLRISTSVAMCT